MPAPRNGSLITPTFCLAWLVNFVQYLIFYILVTAMAVYAVRSFAASDAASGFASSSFVVGATLARLCAGYLVDRWGRRRSMLGALAVVVLSCLLYLVAASLPLLIAVRILHGIGYAFASTAVMTLAQTVIPSARRAEGTGYFALGSTLATAIGPALGLVLAGSVGYTAMFWTTVGLSLVGLVLGFLIPGPPQDDAAPEEEAPRSRFSLGDVAHPAVVPIGLFMFLVGLCYAGVVTYLNAYAEDRGVTAGAGLFFVAYAAAMLVMRFVLGRLQDRRGDNAVVYLGLVCFVIALVLLAAARADAVVVLAGAMTGLGYGTLMPASQAIAVHAVPQHKLGTGISTLLLLTDAGVGFGPIALGALVSATGFGTMYLVLAGVAVFAAVFYQVVHGRHDVARHGRHD